MAMVRKKIDIYKIYINMDFNRVQEMINDLNNTNSVIQKRKKLAKYSDLKQLIQYVYDPSIVFNITSKNVEKLKTKTKASKHYENLFDLLDDLKNRVITGSDAAVEISDFIQRNADYEELIYMILDKNLKIRIASKHINFVFPGLIFDFQVALADVFKPYYIHDKKKNTNPVKWYISRKLDGVRCLIIINKEKKTVECFSRQGKRFETLKNLEKQILENIDDLDNSYVLDGEVVDYENGQENFKGIMEKIKRKDYQIENPYYFVFDMIKLQDFFIQHSKENLETRWKRLPQLKNMGVHILEQQVYTKEKMEELKQISEKKGWEGLMVRMNTCYEGKRTKHLLKYKQMQDEEFKVIDIITGPFRQIDKTTGLEVEIETLSAVVIDYNNTKVGSGFSLKERQMIFENPSLILDKIITVQYQEKTQDSLRFPVFKGLHGTERLL